MEFIGAALERGIDDGAADVAKLRRAVAGDHFHFFQRVHVGVVANAIVDGIVGVDTVQKEVIGLFAIAIHLRAAA